jgi:hypothetical protein
MSVSGWFRFLDFLLLLDEHELRGKRKKIKDMMIF